MADTKHINYIHLCIFVCVCILCAHVHTEQNAMMSNGDKHHKGNEAGNGDEEYRVGMGWLYEIGS